MDYGKVGWLYYGYIDYQRKETMSVYRVLRVRDGEAANRLRDFFNLFWTRVELGAMLAPIQVPGTDEIVSQVIESPEDLALLNPFAPVMQSNAVSMVNEIKKNTFKGPLAVLLRPCELRTLVELRKRRPQLNAPPSFEKPNGCTITIGIDCPGTLVIKEYARQVKALGLERLTRQALASGAEGGFSPALLRMACQLCDWPSPIGADLTIGTFGMLSQQSVLVIAKDESTDSHLGLAIITDGIASGGEISHRESTLKSIHEQRSMKREYLQAMKNGQPVKLGSLLAHFSRCTLCADCLDACPLYDGELSGMLGVGTLSQRERPLFAELIAVSRWLASCSGCGMCEEVCEWGIPLTLLFSLLSRTLDKELQYIAGEPRQCLPWGTG